MATGDWTQSGQQLLVLILHDNLDFVRDASRGLRLRGISCRSLCQMDFDKLSECSGKRIMILIDIDVIERHLLFLRRVLRSKAVEERLFFVNAKRYEKANWAKINNYCDMISLQDKIWRISRES